MEEVIAWGLGFLLGLLYPAPLRSAPRAALFVVLAMLLGTAVTVLSGEWAVNPGFVIVDIGQIGLAAVLGALGRRHLPWRAGLDRLRSADR